MKSISLEDLQKLSRKTPKCIDVMTKAITKVTAEKPVQFDEEDGSVSGLRSALSYLVENGNAPEGLSIITRNDSVILVQE